MKFGGVQEAWQDKRANSIAGYVSGLADTAPDSAPAAQVAKWQMAKQHKWHKWQMVNGNQQVAPATKKPAQVANGEA